MKTAKYIMAALLFGILLLLNGEIYQQHLNTFESGLQYFQCSINDPQEWQDFCRAAKEKCQENHLLIFMKQTQYDGQNNGVMTIYSDSETLLAKQFGLSAGNHKSIFSGSTELSFRPFDDLLTDVQSGDFYLIGNNSDVVSVFRFLFDNYGTSYLRKGSVNPTESFYIAAWLLCTAFLMVLTGFDIAFQKKEVFVRLTLGASVKRIILHSVLQDILVYGALMGIYCLLFHFLLTLHYGNILLACFLLLLVANAAEYLTLLRCNVKKALRRNDRNEGLLFDCYAIKILVMGITMLTLASAAAIIKNNMDFLRQYRNFESLNHYSQVDFRFYDNSNPLVSETHDPAREQMFFEHYDDYHTAFSVQSHGFDDNIRCINVNEAANTLLYGIAEMADINPKLGVHILLPKELEKQEDYCVELALESGECIYPYVKEEAYEVLYYKEAEVLYFDNDLRLNTGFAQNPVICYFTLTQQDFSPINYDEDTALLGHEFPNILFDLDDTDIEELSEEYGLAEADGYMTRINAMDNYNQYRFGILRTLIINLTVSMLFLFFEAAVIGSIVKLEYTSNATELALKSILGYSIWKKHKTMFLVLLYTCCISTATVIIAALMFRLVPWYIALLVGFALFLMESLMVLWHVFRTERTLIVKILKGGAL